MLNTASKLVITDKKSLDLYNFYVQNLKLFNNYSSIKEFELINKTFRDEAPIWRALGRYLMRRSHELGYTVKLGYEFYRPIIPHFYRKEVWYKFFYTICEYPNVLSEYRS